LHRLPRGPDNEEGQQPLFFLHQPRRLEGHNIEQTDDSNLMIQTAYIREMAESFLAEHDGFLVDCTVSEGSDIRVWVDADAGMPIVKCMELSRHIAGQIDGERYDFSLQVSTPGLDQGLKVHRQYLKNVGREVEVQLLDGHRVEGLLEKVDESVIVVKTRVKERIEGRKATHWVETEHDIKFVDIALTKVKISFK
jgi:ribosome maturation factor RimP